MEARNFMPDFFNVSPTMPHGIIIASEDSLMGNCWKGKRIEPESFRRIEIVGIPLRLIDMMT